MVRRRGTESESNVWLGAGNRKEAEELQPPSGIVEMKGLRGEILAGLFSCEDYVAGGRISENAHTVWSGLNRRVNFRRPYGVCVVGSLSPLRG
jgi:hypothetical protein